MLDGDKVADLAAAPFYDQFRSQLANGDLCGAVVIDALWVSVQFSNLESFCVSVSWMRF